jgi:hypothetical protein
MIRRLTGSRPGRFRTCERGPGGWIGVEDSQRTSSPPSRRFFFCFMGQCYTLIEWSFYVRVSRRTTRTVVAVIKSRDQTDPDHDASNDHEEEDENLLQVQPTDYPII